MSKSNQRLAALAGNRAIFALAKSFQIHGLGEMLALNHAARVIGDARENVEGIVAKIGTASNR